MKEEINEILQKLLVGHTGVAGAIEKLENLFQSKVEEIIGENNDDCPCGKLDCPIKRMNDLRAEQRTRLKEML